MVICNFFDFSSFKGFFKISVILDTSTNRHSQYVNKLLDSRELLDASNANPVWHGMDSSIGVLIFLCVINRWLIKSVFRKSIFSNFSKFNFRFWFLLLPCRIYWISHWMTTWEIQFTIFWSPYQFHDVFILLYWKIFLWKRCIWILFVSPFWVYNQFFSRLIDDQIFVD